VSCKTTYRTVALCLMAFMMVSDTTCEQPVSNCTYVIGDAVSANLCLLLRMT
jgi:hypothetical protein